MTEMPAEKPVDATDWAAFWDYVRKSESDGVFYETDGDVRVVHVPKVFVDEAVKRFYYRVLGYKTDADLCPCEDDPDSTAQFVKILDLVGVLDGIDMLDCPSCGAPLWMGPPTLEVVK